jgi:hypothetical protein
MGGHHIKWSKPGSERQKLRIFSHTWKIDPKDKHIHKHKHDYIQTHMKNMFIIAELLMERGKEKENDKASIIS